MKVTRTVVAQQDEMYYIPSIIPSNRLLSLQLLVKLKVSSFIGGRGGQGVRW
jgi:hypothetical protein